eukprot:218537-Pleurochrysis_carterae.AAC.3
MRSSLRLRVPERMCTLPFTQDCVGSQAAAEDLFSAEDESAEAAAESMFGDLSDANGAHETNPFAGEEFIGGDVNPFA